MDEEHNELLVQVDNIDGLDQLVVIDNSVEGDGAVLDTVALTNLDSFYIRGTAQDDVLTVDTATGDRDSVDVPGCIGVRQ